VTFTAGIQKVWHPDLRIGFLSQIADLDKKLPALEAAVATASDATATTTARKAVSTNRTLRFNNLLDVFVAVAFLVLVSAVVLLSVWEWFSLLAKRKSAVLRESEPKWLPDYAVVEPGSKLGGAASTAALTIALAKELSGETQLERAKQELVTCDCAQDGHQQANKSDAEIYLETTERRFTGVRRCC
jgi:hypothetical protein